MPDAVIYRAELMISGEDLDRNIKNSLRFPQFQARKRGAVAICAAGPSLLKQIAMLKALHRAGVPICAVKGTADILIANEIVPAYAVFMDYRPDQVRFFKNPHPDVEYLIAGQSDPGVFDALKGFRVTVWHGEGRSRGLLPKGTAYILGGSTSALRAISLMWAKGFEIHHLFGFDCCADDNGETHVYAPSKEQALRDYYMGERRFRSTPQMVQQYNDFLASYGMNREIDIMVYGNGMIAEAWARLNDPARLFEPVAITFEPSYVGKTISLGADIMNTLIELPAPSAPPEPAFVTI